MKQERILSRWGLVMIGEHGPILAGSEGGGVYRTSTPLVEFDAEAGTGVTASGRPYRLVGAGDPGYALRTVHALWSVKDQEVRVVSPDEAVDLIAAKGNAPFRRTLEEQAKIDGLRLRHISREFRIQMLIAGIDELEAAQRCGLSEDQIRGLLEVDLSRVAVDEADMAFVTLTQLNSNRMRM
ncbi:hypothetical protein [Mesorhizobium sp. 2RAF21]|uniref:hypothetical protein n=1 Tax=Mesorhizobium sp. 2RAF21 TaxID=3232995 RepID=UPI003F9D4F44